MKMTDRQKEIVILMLMAIMVYELDKPTKPVSDLRKRLRKFINHLAKHEKSIYDECMNKANEVWAKVTLEYKDNPDVKLLVSTTLVALYAFIDEVKWIKKKVFTERVFNLAYQSLIHNAIHQEMGDEQETYHLVERLAHHLGMIKDRQLKLKAILQKVTNEE
jgi:hypothetical protein